METRTLAVEGQNENAAMEEKNRPSSNSNTSLRFFWDGGLLANTPLRQTVIAHRHYWHRVRKLEDNIPRLKFGIINLHPDNKNIFLLTMIVLLTERMISYITTEQNLMNLLQF